MSENINFRLAQPEDDEPLRALLRGSRMPGAISLAPTCEPSFFRAIEVEGFDRQTIVAVKADRILGVGVAGKRLVCMNGRAREVGYLSRLRLAPEIRNTPALARGYQFLRRCHDEFMKVPFYFTSIMEDNSEAVGLLTSRRAGLPIYRPLARYCTTLIPARCEKRSRPFAKVQVVSGKEFSSSAIMQFVNNVGRNKEFYPVYSESDLDKSNGLLRGLRLDDFLVAKEDGRIVGTLALWDQSAFRQIIVARYSPWMKFVRGALKPLCRLLGVAALPATGVPVRISTAACVAIEGNRSDIFGQLLVQALHQLKKKNKDFLLVGVAQSDPLQQVAESFLHLTVNSQIYTVAWDEEVVCDLDGRIPYFELGSL